MYDGPVVDTYIHPDWGTRSRVLGDRSAFLNDPMRRRVMATFREDREKDHDKSKGIEQTVAAMDEAGVVHAVLQATLQYPTVRETLDEGIREHVEIIERFPGRFSHCGTILPPPQGSATYWDLIEPARTVEAHQREHGILGVHLLNAAWGLPPNNKYYYPLYAKCVELGLVVFSYVGIPGPLWPSYPNYPLCLDDVCLAFPELKVVAHHIGDPWVKMMCHLAAKHENLFIQTSAWSPRHYPAELLEFMAGRWHGQAGADKVIFATDHPFVNISRGVRDARSLKLGSAELEKFLYANAIKQLPTVSTAVNSKKRPNVQYPD